MLLVTPRIPAPSYKAAHRPLAWPLILTMVFQTEHSLGGCTGPRNSNKGSNANQVSSGKMKARQAHGRTHAEYKPNSLRTSRLAVTAVLPLALTTQQEYWPASSSVVPLSCRVPLSWTWNRTSSRGFASSTFCLWVQRCKPTGRVAGWLLADVTQAHASQRPSCNVAPGFTLLLMRH